MRPPHHRRRRGNAVLEAALVIPILVLLAFGTVEFAHFFFVKHTLQGAAREGARAAIIATATSADAQAAAASALQAAGLADRGCTVAVSPSDLSEAAEGTMVTVTVRCAWVNVGIRPLRLIGADRQVSASVTMRREG